MEEDCFAVEKFSQTVAEEKADRARMKKLKKKLEQAVEGVRLHIDDVSEWAKVWRIPLTFEKGATELRESHFQVIRGYGVELCVMEMFSEHHNNEYLVEMKKCRHFWRGWTWFEMFFLFSTILGLFVVMYLMYHHVK